MARVLPRQIELEAKEYFPEGVAGIVSHYANDSYGHRAALLSLEMLPDYAERHPRHGWMDYPYVFFSCIRADGSEKQVKITREGIDLYGIRTGIIGEEIKTRPGTKEDALDEIFRCGEIVRVDLNNLLDARSSRQPLAVYWNHPLDPAGYNSRTI